MTGPYRTLLIDRNADGFATITLNRPDQLNTLSIELRRELRHAVATLEADADVHVLVLTAAGRVFSAGLNIDEWDTAGLAAAGAYEHDAVAALMQFSGPVIGAVNGAAMTGGLELALACDVLIASSDASFADTHVAVGLLPGWGGSVRLIQRLGLHRAKVMALTAQRIGADEALAIGLVEYVVPSAELLASAQALAQRMLRHPAAGLARYKRLLDEVAAMPMSAALEHERAVSRAANAVVRHDELAKRLERVRLIARPGSKTNST